MEYILTFFLSQFTVFTPWPKTSLIIITSMTKLTSYTMHKITQKFSTVQ